MNNSSLIGTYFRQQAEISMPDFPIDHDCITILAGINVATDGAKHDASPGDCRIAPPAKNPSPTPLKNRLSQLRPVSRLVSSIPVIAPAGITSHPAASEEDETILLSKRSQLKEMYLAGCTRCCLAESRKKLVFGSGNADAPVMIIGESPGIEDDIQGVPFAGEDGKLLTAMLSAIGLDRSRDVFITTLLKCRPVDEHSLQPELVATCLPVLKRQIEIIRPKIILFLGSAAARFLLNVDESLDRLRSTRLAYGEIPVMVIHSPAALLDDTALKRSAWEDLKIFRKLLTDTGVYGSLYKK